MRNIPPGTVVEEEVTSQDYSDFFLASHVGALVSTSFLFFFFLFCSLASQITYIGFGFVKLLFGCLLTIYQVFVGNN